MSSNIDMLRDSRLGGMLSLVSVYCGGEEKIDPAEATLN